MVCVTKMDLVHFAEDCFQRVCSEVRCQLEEVGCSSFGVFIPTSGLAGDNVAQLGVPWYSGPTVLDALCAAAHHAPLRPLRIPLQEVMQIGGTGVVAVGRVETGRLRPGMRLVFAPGNVPVTALSLERHHEPLEEAKAGDTVSFRVDVAMKDLRRGMVGSMQESMASECSSFVAQIIVLGQPAAGLISEESSFMIDCHMAQMPCVLVELISLVDKQTGKVSSRPRALHTGDMAVVCIKPQGRMSVEAFSEFPPLGRFALREQKATIAVGVIQEVERMPVCARPLDVERTKAARPQFPSPFGAFGAKRPAPSPRRRCESSE